MSDAWNLHSLEALAEEVHAHVEVRSWVQDTEGAWRWMYYPAPLGTGTWDTEHLDDQVMVEARLVSNWEPVDRTTVRDHYESYLQEIRKEST